MKNQNSKSLKSQEVNKENFKLSKKDNNQENLNRSLKLSINFDSESQNNNQININSFDKNVNLINTTTNTNNNTNNFNDYSSESKNQQPHNNNANLSNSNNRNRGSRGKNRNKSNQKNLINLNNNSHLNNNFSNNKGQYNDRNNGVFHKRTNFSDEKSNYNKYAYNTNTYNNEFNLHSNKKVLSSSITQIENNKCSNCDSFYKFRSYFCFKCKKKSDIYLYDNEWICLMCEKTNNFKDSKKCYFCYSNRNFDLVTNDKDLKFGEFLRVIGNYLFDGVEVPDRFNSNVQNAIQDFFSEIYTKVKFA